MINSLVNNFFFHLLIYKKQLMPTSSEKKKNGIVCLDVSLKEEADLSTMLINFYHNTWLHLPEDNVHTHWMRNSNLGTSLTRYLHACNPPTPTTHTHTHTHSANYENVLYWECIELKKNCLTHTHLNYKWIYKRFYPRKWLFKVQTEKNM